MTKLVGLSLFSNIGVAEAYLEKIGVHVAVANELLEERAAFYQEVYPNTNMICGDITNSDVYQQIIDESKRAGVNFIMATPPCQGMSTAGKQNPNDVRNWLIVYAMNAIRDVNPKFILLENVPQQLKTKICINGQTVLMRDIILLSRMVKKLKDMIIPISANGGTNPVTQLQHTMERFVRMITFIREDR